MLRVLLNRYHPNISDAPVQYLPQEIAKPIFNIQINSKDPLLGLMQPLEQIKSIHYSWFLPALKKFPVNLQPIILSSLPSDYGVKLQSLLKLPPSEKKQLAPPIQALLADKLFRLVKPDGIMPLAYLPESPLTTLSQFNKQQLVEVIDFLGIYDLAEGIRHIIDKTFLQKLYACLSHKQKQFLRICLHQQEKISTARMEMSVWDGDCKKLDLMLQRRGLLRLGKAMCGMHPDFVWHLTRILDSGRGNILLKYYTPEATPGVTVRLIQQVTALLNFLTPKGNP